MEHGDRKMRRVLGSRLMREGIKCLWIGAAAAWLFLGAAAAQSGTSLAGAPIGGAGSSESLHSLPGSVFPGVGPGATPSPMPEVSPGGFGLPRTNPLITNYGSAGMQRLPGSAPR